MPSRRRFRFIAWLLRLLARLPKVEVWFAPAPPVRGPRRPRPVTPKPSEDHLSRPPRRIFLRGKVVEIR